MLSYDCNAKLPNQLWALAKDSKTCSTLSDF